MATKDWRDVARRARQYKFDRFHQKASAEAASAKPTPDNAEATTKPSSEKQVPQPNIPPQDSPRAAFSRHASMDFRGKVQVDVNMGNSAKNGGTERIPEMNKRASWAGRPTSSRPAPPPPPKPTQAEAKPAPPTPPPKRGKVSQPPFNDENAGTNSCGTPGKTAAGASSSSGATPLQPRTPNITPAATSATKKAPTTATKSLQTRPFAKLMKEGTLSYYEMLEVTVEASEKDITKAFRTWARAVHPDHNRETTATEDFQALQQIYDTLRVPMTRLAYNCRQKVRRCAFSSRTRRSAQAAASGFV